MSHSFIKISMNISKYYSLFNVVLTIFEQTCTVFINLIKLQGPTFKLCKKKIKRKVIKFIKKIVKE